ncbi:flippase [Robertmurraya sp. FSL R5-0851]|uniref:flippase n=1 Tax=Robertmurraya sp. FSL R5-0851 TaxID=2921584 RepID=UPI0030FB3782
MSSKKKLLENFFSLLFLQGFNFLLPLLTLPYLVRVLGPANYGVIAFALAFVQFFVIITDYGFNLTATRQISINRDNHSKLEEIYNSVLNSKLLIMVISFVGYFLIVTLVPRFSKDVELFLWAYGMVVGNVLFPVWFFQGMEKMKFISILNVISKLVFASGIFIFVQGKSDLILVPILQSIGFIVAGVIALFVIRLKFGVKYRLSSIESIRYQLKDGLDVFLSTVAISLYTISNTFILGLFTNNTIVGYYASAEKLINAATGLITPVSQTVYPHLNKLVIESKERALQFLKKMLYGISLVTGLVSIIIFFFSNHIVDIVLGPNYGESVVILKILAFLPLIIGLSNVFGVQTLLTFGFKKVFSRILIIASTLSVVLALILVPNFEVIGTAIGFVVTELFVTICMGCYLYNKKINLWR